MLPRSVLGVSITFFFPEKNQKMFFVIHREAGPSLIMDECGVSGLQEDADLVGVHSAHT